MAGVAVTAAFVVAGLLVLAVVVGTGPGPRSDPGARPGRGSRATRWNAFLDDRVAAVQPAADVALVCDLVAAAVQAGLPPGRALDAALDALTAEGFVEEPALRRVAVQLSWGSDPEEAWIGLAADTGPRWEELAEPLVLSARTGAPAVSLLTSAAASVRAERRWTAEAAAARLSASLVLPLGLCTLPAFLLLGVVPVVVTVAQDVLGS